jgi:hypothetical protein
MKSSNRRLRTLVAMLLAVMAMSIVAPLAAQGGSRSLATGELATAEN